MQTTAKLNGLLMTPRKVRIVADLVRGMPVREALVQLAHHPRQAALPVKKLLESAVANAGHNHALKKETLTVKTIFVDSGHTLDRWMPRAFGRAAPIRKRTSRITVVLEGDVEEKKK